MRVKICGLMRPTDVAAATNFGADAVGFVVASPSSQRNLGISRAKKLMRGVPIFATKVAVTSSHDVSMLHRICSTLKPDALQLHRHNHQIVRRIREAHPETSLILATAIRDSNSVLQAERSSNYADAVLADSPSMTGLGGTGRKHNWALTSILRRRIAPHPLILAGGLSPDNVGLAIRKVKPFAVDVSTGVEQRIGVKDYVKIREFIMNAKEALG